MAEPKSTIEGIERRPPTTEDLAFMLNAIPEGAAAFRTLIREAGSAIRQFVACGQVWLPEEAVVVAARCRQSAMHAAYRRRARRRSRG